MLRADLLPPADAAHVRSLLGAYLDQRILFYINRDATRQPQIDQSTSQLQTDLWVAVRGPAAAQPTPVMALVLAGTQRNWRRSRFSGAPPQSDCPESENEL